MAILKILFLFFIVVWGGTLQADVEVRQGLYLGEENWDVYSGPKDPRTVNGKFLDDLKNETFIDQSLIPHAPELSNFLQGDLLDDYECPLGMMAIEFRYMRYLYRLLSLSFLFEELREIQRISIKLQLEGATCKVNWKKFLNRCGGESEYMDSFSKRSSYFIKDLKDFLALSRLKKRSSDDWIKKFEAGKLVGRENIVGTRLEMWCKSHDCKNLSSKKLGKALYGICLQDLNLFNNICSEKDDFYGLYDLPLMTTLLEESHVRSLLDKQMNSRACLFKFSSHMKQKENIPDYVYGLFQEINNQLQNQKDSRYRQGMLFLPGSLQEFDKKGLKDFLFGPKEKPTASPTATARPTPTPFPTAAPLPSPTAVPTPSPIPTVAPTPDRLSYFGKQVRKFEAENLKNLNIDLEKLRLDFEFKKEVKDKLKIQLAKFLKRKALKQMKVNDKLGTSKAPLPILFIKYFIEDKQYQALFNITGEIGNYFFVFNDIDKVGKPVMVELKYLDKNWSLKLVRFVPKTKVKKIPNDKKTDSTKKGSKK